jgi:hypothetical protein
MISATRGESTREEIRILSHPNSRFAQKVRYREIQKTAFGVRREKEALSSG